MKIKILYLYYDLMNLYGENGNVRVLTRALEEQGFEVTVEGKTIIDDDIDFSSADFVYMGSGTESARNAALKHFSEYKEPFREAAASGKLMLLTGNSWEKHGNKITLCDGSEINGLELLNFDVTEHRDKRFTGDAIMNCELFGKPCVGFINKCSEITPVDFFLFDAEMGMGNSISDKHEGICAENVYGTHLTGPIMAKNPHFLRYIVKSICDATEGAEYHETESPYAEKGYEITLSELRKRMEKEN